MEIEFQRWPEDLAMRYRERGYWLGLPLTYGLERQSLERPDATAIICAGRSLSYAELDRYATNLATRLAQAGLGRGDTALVQLPNVAEFYIVFFALLKIGVAPVNALFSHRRLELAAYARQVAPRLVIASRDHELFRDDMFLEELAQISPALSLVLLRAGEGPSHNLESWIKTEPRQTATFSPSGADKVAFFQLSGGTTATPKLIPRTHNDYDYSVRASAEICGIGPETRFLCALPAAHNYPLSSPGALGVFYGGGCVVLAPDPEPFTCFRLIREHAVNMVALVPAAVAVWIDALGRDDKALPSLRLMQVGGANFPPAVAKQVPEVFGCKLQQVFGMAEGFVNYTRLDDADALVFTTQGRPISPDDEIRIVDAAGDDVADGEVGMLAVRGPYTVRGYYKSPEHNRRAFDQDGFYYSGDLVRRTGQGYLQVVGRVKDQINRGGEKIAAEEIENLLLRHPDVLQAALVGVKDAVFGEKSCAFILSRNCGLKAAALRRHLMTLGVAQYKLPDLVRFVDAMPLTPVGKIDKKQLRGLLASPEPLID